MPKGTPLAHDPDGSAGTSIDQVWSHFTTGRPSVRIGQPVPTPAAPYTRPPSMGAAAAPVLTHLPGSRSRLDVVQAAWDGRV